MKGYNLGLPGVSEVGASVVGWSPLPPESDTIPRESMSQMSEIVGCPASVTQNCLVWGQPLTHMVLEVLQMW